MRDEEHDFENGYDPDFDGADLIDALDEMDDDESLYLDEADRASRNKRHHKTMKMRHGPNNSTVLRGSTKDTHNRLSRAHRAALKKARSIGRRQVRPAVGGVLATLGKTAMKRYTHRIESAFNDAAAHAIRKAAGVSTPGQAIAIPITAIVTTVARKVLRPKFGERTDKIVGWIQIALDAVIPAVVTLSSEDDDDDFDLDGASFEEEDEFDLGIDDDYDTDDFDEMLPAAAGSSGRNPRQTRACSQSLRRAARHLLRVERQLGTRLA